MGCSCGILACPADHTMQDLALHSRFTSIEGRLQKLEAAVYLKGPHDLHARFKRMEATLANLEAHYGLRQAQHELAASAQASQHAGSAVGGMQKCLTQELQQRGVSGFKFVRVPGRYYDQPLEFRRDCLGAASVEHLCKSIIMQNKADHDNIDCDHPEHSKYFLVIVQYAARLDAEKIKHHMHKLHGGKGINNFKMKLVDETVSGKLTGFERNAVSPVGSKTQLPIVVSDKISQLIPDFFWLGAGETDLKLGMSFAAFKAAYEPMIINCTSC